MATPRDPYKTQKTTNLTRTDPRRIYGCIVADCKYPRGNRNAGFTKQGLANHTGQLHKTPAVATVLNNNEVVDIWPGKTHAQVATDEDAPFSRDELVKYRDEDANYEVVMGAPVALDRATPIDTNSMTQDIKDLLQLNEEDAPPTVVEVPVGSADEGGAAPYVYIKARQGRLYYSFDATEWIVVTLEEFTELLRFAVRIS